MLVILNARSDICIFSQIEVTDTRGSFETLGSYLKKVKQNTKYITLNTMK